MSRCGLPTGLVWLSESKKSPNKLFQGDTLSPNKVKQPILPFLGGVSILGSNDARLVQPPPKRVYGTFPYFYFRWKYFLPNETPFFEFHIRAKTMASSCLITVM